MWKGKSALRTVNLCNEYLVLYLNKKKSQLQKIGMDRKAMVYHTAIASIKKYPLPIICLEQLKSLYGIGDLLSQQLLNVIKYHYKSFLKEVPARVDNDLKADDGDQRSVSWTKSTDLVEMRKRRVSGSKSELGIEGETRSLISCKSVNQEKEYRPRANTNGAYVILALQKTRDEGFIDKQSVLGELKSAHSIKITAKQYLILLSNLCASEYIQRDDQDSSFIRLTKKGEKYAEALHAKTKEKQSCVKVKQVLTQFKFRENQSSKPKVAVSDRLMQKRVYQVEGGQMTLLIDTREMKDKQEQSFFQRRISERYGMSCRTCNLPLGDFMWDYEGQIVDYVVERKKADDLVSSIHDGRYKEQKYRLKNSGFSNVVYLLEGHLTAGFAKSEREVESAVLKTRVKDGFKVVTVNNITESARLISFVTQQLQQKLRREHSLASLGPLQEVASSNGKASQLKVQNIFGLSLKTIPGIGKNAVNEVLKHFRCFRQLYDALLQLQNRFERVEFIRELLKGCGVRSTLPELLADIMFEGKNKQI